MSTATCPRPSTVATRATLAWAAMRRMTDLFTMRFLFLACSVRSPGPVSGRTCPHHFDKTAHQNVRPAPRLTFRRVAFATNELCRGSRTASAGPGTGPRSGTRQAGGSDRYRARTCVVLEGRASVDPVRTRPVSDDLPDRERAARPRSRGVLRDDNRAVVRDSHRPHLAGAVRVDLVFHFDLAVVVFGLQVEMTPVGTGATGTDAATASRSECRRGRDRERSGEADGDRCGRHQTSGTWVVSHCCLLAGF